MKNKISKIFIAVFGIFLVGCLEDDKQPLDPSGSQNIIEFLDPSVPTSPAGAIYPAWTTSFSVSPEASFEQIVSFSGPNSNDKDIQLTLEVDPVALQEFNTQMEDLGSSTYELLPAENYSIPTTVTIPRGQTKVSVPVTVYPDKFDLSRTFAIPLRIASASHGTLSAHYSVAILATVVKNKYDGIYTIDEGSMVDVTNATFTSPDYPLTVELRTVDGSTVDYFDAGNNLQGHLFTTPDGASYYGGFVARFRFDENNVVIAVENALGQGNNNRSGKLDPDPAAPIPVMTFEDDGVTPKTLTIWYVMRQINTGVDRTFWKETYNYVGPRE